MDMVIAAPAVFPPEDNMSKTEFRVSIDLQDVDVTPERLAESLVARFLDGSQYGGYVSAMEVTDAAGKFLAAYPTRMRKVYDGYFRYEQYFLRIPRTWVTVWEDENDIVIVATEAPGQTTSVTNSIEHIVAQLLIKYFPDVNKIVKVWEHYPNDDSRLCPTWDIVTFGSQYHGGSQAMGLDARGVPSMASAQWKSSTREAIEREVGETVHDKPWEHVDEPATDYAAHIVQKASTDVRYRNALEEM